MGLSSSVSGIREWGEKLGKRDKKEVGEDRESRVRRLKSVG